jgi:hypothetical protein
MLPLLFLLLLTAPQVSRKPTPTQDEIVLFGGDLAAFSLSNGISMMQMQSQFAIQHQEPELKIPFPVLLQTRHEMVIDWTDGQHARYLMEEIRQGVYALRGHEENNFDAFVGIRKGRELWPKIRDIACKDKPSLLYYHLDGTKDYCPD